LIAFDGGLKDWKNRHVAQYLNSGPAPAGVSF
jgi:hypothetical protein